MKDRVGTDYGLYTCIHIHTLIHPICMRKLIPSISCGSEAVQKISGMWQARRESWGLLVGAFLLKTALPCAHQLLI